MTRIIFPDFREEQGDSRYPFSDTATLRSNTGFFIPKECFVDINVYIINGELGTYLSAIVIDNNSVTLRFSDLTRRNTCTAHYGPLALGTEKYNTLTLADIHGRQVGVIVGLNSGLKLLSGWPVGTHTFAPAATELVASVVTPAQEPGVRGLLAPSGELLTGDVWLIGDQGVVLREIGNNTIQVNVVGVPLFKRVQCLDENGNPIGDFSPRNFLKTINGCGPDEYGNFTITVAAHTDGTTDGLKAASILRIYPENNGLKIGTVGSRVF